VLTVRAFDPQSDYGGLAWLERGLNSSDVSEDVLRERDAARDPTLAFARLVALWDWEVIGAAEATQRPEPYPTHAEVRLGVRQDFRGRGIARALLTGLRDRVRDAGGEVLLAYTDEREHDRNAFWSRMGFTESFRGYQQYLSLERVDLESITVDWKRILEADIDFRTLADLRHEWGCAQKLYALYCEVEDDVPRVDALYAPKSFETFCTEVFDAPSSLPEGTWIAVRTHDWGTEYLGCNFLYRDDGGRVLHNGLTGVRREARGLGLALALKYKGIEFARNAGFEGITTFNASTNAAILKLNARLGFERQGTTVEWRASL
jgi:GNAT superfamily N-acetyltransferase